MSEHGRSENLDSFIREATRPARILLIEDDKFVIETMHRAVKGLNCELTTNESVGCSVCDHVEHGSYDLILVDLVMPGVDTGKLIEKLVAQSKKTCSSIVVFTRYPGNPEAIAAVKAGVMVFIIKPDMINQQWLCSVLRTFRIQPLAELPKA